MNHLLTTLIHTSLALGASDLHLSQDEIPIMRKDGELVRMTTCAALDANTLQQLIYNMLNTSQQKIFETSLELDFAFHLPGICRVRAHIFHQQKGLAAVFRLIPHNIPTLESLNAPPIIKEILKYHSGLILVTGATGCGKSTTLAAMIDDLNTHEPSHIITIEDPVEFIHTNKKSLVHQRQIHSDAVSFSSALRAALREDPDVILIGEMRDAETIRLALTAAETGHLVLGTLHASTAPQAVTRMIDVFPAGEKDIIRKNISASLQAVISQQLIRKRDEGRAAAYEIMLATAAIRNLIREDKIAQILSVMQTSRQFGMTTMEQAVNELVAKNMAAKDAMQEWLAGSRVNGKMD
jgi:twitching motility protein PilT